MASGSYWTLASGNCRRICGAGIAASSLLLGLPLVGWARRRSALDPIRYTVAGVADDIARPASGPDALPTAPLTRCAPSSPGASGASTLRKARTVMGNPWFESVAVAQRRAKATGGVSARRRKVGKLNPLEAVRDRARDLWMRDTGEETWAALLAKLRRETPATSSTSPASCRWPPPPNPAKTLRPASRRARAVNAGATPALVHTAGLCGRCRRSEGARHAAGCQLRARRIARPCRGRLTSRSPAQAGTGAWRRSSAPAPFPTTCASSLGGDDPHAVAARHHQRERGHLYLPALVRHRERHAGAHRGPVADRGRQQLGRRIRSPSTSPLTPRTGFSPATRASTCSREPAFRSRPISSAATAGSTTAWRSTFDYRTQNFGFSQRYEPLNRAYAAERQLRPPRDDWRAAPATPKTSWQASSTPDGSTMSCPWTCQLAQARRQENEERSQFRSLVGRHQLCTGQDAVDQHHRQCNADPGGSGGTGRQQPVGAAVSSVGLWQREGSKLQLSGSARACWHATRMPVSQSPAGACAWSKLRTEPKCTSQRQRWRQRDQQRRDQYPGFQRQSWAPTGRATRWNSRAALRLFRQRQRRRLDRKRLVYRRNAGDSRHAARPHAQPVVVAAAAVQPVAQCGPEPGREHQQLQPTPRAQQPRQPGHLREEERRPLPRSCCFTRWEPPGPWAAKTAAPMRARRTATP